MNPQIEQFFERYEDLFNRALAGEADMDEVAAMYATEFIAASPAGVMAGRNDEQLKEVMASGYDRYRAMGTKAMQLRGVRVSKIDDLHCVAHVSWASIYERQDKADVTIEFEVHYLLQVLAGVVKVFGWVAGDEQALLRERGIIPAS